MKENTFKRLLKYLKPHRLRLFFVLLFRQHDFHSHGALCHRPGHNNPV